MDIAMSVPLVIRVFVLLFCLVVIALMSWYIWGVLSEIRGIHARRLRTNQLRYSRQG